MSRKLFALNHDLKRLQDEGYDVAAINGYLVMRDVPYVNAQRQIKLGILITKLTLANDKTCEPDDHVAMFAGEYPCDSSGRPIEQMRNGTVSTDIGNGIVATYTFSAKPMPSGKYPNYYAKLVNYANIISGPAAALEPVSARTFPTILEGEQDSVFKYTDTASSRAEITAVTKKLAIGKVAIIGLGGTGSYILDQVAKTPVGEIHLIDGDRMLQHNAFRSPGAPSGEDLGKKPFKVHHFQAIYSNMHRSIIAHAEFISEQNLALLEGVNFAFLCMEGRGKKLIVKRLEQLGIPFVDVGMGIYFKNGALGGILRVTTSTPVKREHVWEHGRIPFSGGDEANEYDQNIQIADLNMLNAALAVIKWKKLFGFYLDQEQEHFCVYMIGGNDIISEDK